MDTSGKPICDGSIRDFLRCACISWTEINSEAQLPEPGIPVLLAVMDTRRPSAWFTVEVYWSESAAAWCRSENDEPLPEHYLDIAWLPRPMQHEVEDFLRQMSFHR